MAATEETAGTADRERNLRVLLANEDEGALDALARVVKELGHEVIARAVSVDEASGEIVQEQPDVAMVKMHDDSEHALELIEEIVEEANCPVIALMNGENAEFVSAAAERGIQAYARVERIQDVQAAIEVAVRRHADMRELSEEVEQLESALDRRAIIERAKGILMERQSLDEQAAFALIREHARSNNRRVIDVARSVAEGHALLPKQG
jgi:response regulator NasT